MPEVIVDIYRVGRSWSWRVVVGSDEDMIVRAQSPRTFRNSDKASSDFNNFRNIFMSSQPVTKMGS
jgi:hypothetical protein